MGIPVAGQKGNNKVLEHCQKGLQPQLFGMEMKNVRARKCNQERRNSNKVENDRQSKWKTSLVNDFVSTLMDKESKIVPGKNLFIKH